MEPTMLKERTMTEVDGGDTTAEGAAPGAAADDAAEMATAEAGCGVAADGVAAGGDVGDVTARKGDGKTETEDDGGRAGEDKAMRTAAAVAAGGSASSGAAELVAAGAKGFGGVAKGTAGEHVEEEEGPEGEEEGAAALTALAVPRETLADKRARLLRDWEQKAR